MIRSRLVRNIAARFELRRGNILALTALFMSVVLAFTAFTVDIGFITLTKTQMQAAADAAALAASMELTSSDDAATVRANCRAAAASVAANFENGDRSSVALNTANDVLFGKQVSIGNGQFSTQWGDQYTPHNIVKVLIRRRTETNSQGQLVDNRLPLFFGPAIGNQNVTLQAEAVAAFQPRDIVIVLDFSASMNDDSSLGAIDVLGRTYVESNLQTMWQELGSPVYGNLTFTPQYATLAGGPLTGSYPHIDVTYKRTSVSIVSTSSLKKVTLRMSGNRTQTFSNLSGTTGTFQGTGSNSGREIQSVSVESGGNANRSGDGLGERFNINSTTIKSALGLTGTYPYAAGSWDEYISTVQSSSGEIKDAGYRDQYGYLTWLHYLQYERPAADETADLWKTSEQPLECLKDGVDLFIQHLIDLPSEDQVGLSIYTHTSSAGAILEHGLIRDYEQIKNTTRHRQAGHYTGGTNISAGMAVARAELQAHARPRAHKLMLVMTDGQANAPGSASQAYQAVITEAYAAKNAGIKVVTISVGLGADTELLDEVAAIGNGEHFNVPGGQSIADVQAQLLQVFRRVATSRPLKLID